MSLCRLSLCQCKPLQSEDVWDVGLGGRTPGTVTLSSDALHKSMTPAGLKKNCGTLSGWRHPISSRKAIDPCICLHTINSQSCWKSFRGAGFSTTFHLGMLLPCHRINRFAPGVAVRLPQGNLPLISFYAFLSREQMDMAWHYLAKIVGGLWMVPARSFQALLNMQGQSNLSCLSIKERLVLTAMHLQSKLVLSCNLQNFVQMELA
jgi:hypothetical protein